MVSSNFIADSNSSRVDWIDYAKGICIVAVVCFYSTVYVQDVTGARGWLNYWVDFARPFRMPDFFVLSGLFLGRVIDRPWRNYFDRKVLHYLYFFILWTTFYGLAEVALVRGSLTHKSLAEYLWWYIEPFHQLWFIAMLPVYCLVTRAVRRVHWMVILLLAGLIQIAHPEFGLRQLDRFGERYVYFYAGYVFAPFVLGLGIWAKQHVRKAVVALGVWAVVNEVLVICGVSEQRGFSLALGFAGAAGVMVTASLLARWRAMGWLRYLGQNSIVIFLAFYAFMVVAAHTMWRYTSISDSGSQALMITAVSILGPVLLYWTLLRTPGRFLFERPDWAKLSSQSESQLRSTVRVPDVA